ncbi:MAG: hypothetical protein EXS36_14165 [Pedosphaera sp.]|nr:hypothetical protein [Pedosphaera sp.]
MLDFSSFPPAVTHVTNIPNSVIGPPSNIAIHPNGRMALVASSIKIASPTATNWVPDNRIYILDLSHRPPRVVSEIQAELQPSGMSFTSDGRKVLVANRGTGTISVFAVDGFELKPIQSVKVCEPSENVSDVAVSPDGNLALASVKVGGYVAVLRFDGREFVVSKRKTSVSGQPYRLLITPDGELGLVAGLGFGKGVDVDELSIIDLRAREPRTIDHVPLGTVPESIELNPDGRLLAAVVMDGSSLPPGDPLRTDKAHLIILERKGKTFVRRQRLDFPPVPSGVVFTGDGRYLVVQCHLERELYIYAVHGSHVRDTGQRIPVPGMPSSLRAGPKP